jgi:hypothetical protein
VRYTEVVIGAVVVFEIMQLAIATVPEAMLGIMFTADVPMFLATYEIFE